MDDYYQILRVSNTATKAEIKAAFRRLARKYHPDVNKDKDASKNFRLINGAYEVLCDDAKRADYDRKFGESFVYPKRTSAEKTAPGPRAKRASPVSENKNKAQEANQKFHRTASVRSGQFAEDEKLSRFFLIIFSVFAFPLFFTIAYLAVKNYEYPIKEFSQRKISAYDNVSESVYKVAGAGYSDFYDKFSPLYVAMKKGNHKRSNDILEWESYNLEEIEDKALIMYAIYFGWKDTAKLLLEKGFSCKPSGIENLAIREYVSEEDEKYYEKLQAVSFEIYNPADYAKEMKRTEIVEMLEKRGVYANDNPRIKMDYKKALMIYSERRMTETYEEILVDLYLEEIINKDYSRHKFINDVMVGG
ncbi:MAG: DnaJ domain-containing protein [Lactobacillaceae bacterium]|jgi:curved DNA-binding protein CbpA|nr:DnaJ domain-containing protein [Lactobacillaceae bacterium]